MKQKVKALRVRKLVAPLGTAALVSGILLAAPAAGAAADPLRLPANGPTSGGTEVTAPFDTASDLALTPVGASQLGSFGTDATGRLYAWGDTESGQIGTGTPGPVTVPRDVALPPGVTPVDTAFGSNSSTVLGSDGSVYSWGSNSYGQLGNGSTAQGSSVPVRTLIPDGVTITQVAQAGGNALALASDGTAYAWGRDDLGVLGDGKRSQDIVRTPQPVKMPPGIRFTALFARTPVAIALDQNGGMWTWGAGDQGGLGDGQTGRYHYAAEPTKVPLPAGVVFTSVMPGNGNTWAKTANGDFYRWGPNVFGDLGTGGTNDLLRPTLFTPPKGLVFTDIFPGIGHVFGRTSTGEVYAWGDNNNGVLGDGTTTASPVPVPIEVPAGIKLTGALVAGQNHNLAIGSDGKMYAWGNNSRSQFGDGGSTGSRVPTPITLAQDPLTVTQVTFDGTPGTNLKQVPGTWTATTPAHDCAVVDVVVDYKQGPRTWSETIASGFTYGSAAVITEQPDGGQVDEDGDYVLSADASGDAPPTVQWQQAPSENGPWTDIAAATLPSLTVKPTSTMFYRAVFTNCLGAATSDTAKVVVPSKPPVTPSPSVTPKPSITPPQPPATATPMSPTPKEALELALTGAKPAPWILVGGSLLLAVGFCLVGARSRLVRRESRG